MKLLAALLLLPLAGGCDALPRDPEGTLARVAATRTFRVAVAGPLTPADRAHAVALVGEVARRTGATPRIERGPLEPLVARLEDGGVDLLLATFAGDTPWAEDIALSPPLSPPAGKRKLALRAAITNGENRWIMLVERSARAVAPEAAGG